MMRTHVAYCGSPLYSALPQKVSVKVSWHRKMVLGAALIMLWGGVAFAVSTLPTSVPPEPTLTVTADTGTGEVVLSWSTTTGSYVTVRSTAPDFFGDTPPQVLASGLAGTSYRDPVLTDGMMYFYKIEDANAAPKIYSMSSNAGLPGDSITLTGVGFDSSSLLANEVTVGGEAAVITGVTDTTLTYLVPAGVLGRVVVSSTKGATAGKHQYTVATSGLTNISSLGVDEAHVPFLADTGGGATSDKVFKFDPSTGTRTQVGSLNEATGLPNDIALPNHLYYGNAVVPTPPAANFGTIRRTDSSGADIFYRQCGNSTSGDQCYVFGVGLDPFLTDFGSDGRLYVADGAPSAQKVRIVPLAGLITDFATGFTFGGAPRGIVVDLNSSSPFYHDVLVSDLTAVRRFNSATFPVPPQKTYNSSNSPVASPRQMAITPWPKERLLIADDSKNRILMINPATDKSKSIDIPLTDPRGIALDQDVNGKTFAYVAEPTRVLMFPIYKTVIAVVWVADGSIAAPIVQREINRAKAILEKCGIELQVRAINPFSAGPLLDLEINNWNVATCGAGLSRTSEEQQLLDAPATRSSEPTDLNIYYVRSFTVMGSPDPHGTAAETVTSDCFPGISDQSNSGIILAAQKITMFPSADDSVPLLAHEIGHALIDRGTWGQDEHNDPSGTPYGAKNVMNALVSRMSTTFDNDQCSNINMDLTVFRGDP